MESRNLVIFPAFMTFQKKGCSFWVKCSDRLKGKDKIIRLKIKVIQRLSSPEISCSWGHECMSWTKGYPFNSIEILMSNDFPFKHHTNTLHVTRLFTSTIHNMLTANIVMRISPVKLLTYNIYLFIVCTKDRK